MRAGVKEGPGVRPPCGRWPGRAGQGPGAWLGERAGQGRAATENAKQSGRRDQTKTPPVKKKSVSESLAGASNAIEPKCY